MVFRLTDLTILNLLAGQCNPFRANSKAEFNRPIASMHPQSRTTKTIILSIGKALASVSGLLLTIVLVRLFSKEDFATYRQTFLVYAMAAPFMGMGLSQSVVYFIPTATKKRQGAIILEAMGPLCLAGLLYCFFIVFGGSRIIASVWNNPKLEHTLLIVAPIALLTMARSVLPASLVATQKVYLATVFGVVTGISASLVSVIVAFFVPNLEWILVANLLVSCVVFLLSLVILFRNFSFEKPTLVGVGKQLAFGLPLCFSTTVLVISKNLDRVMVSSLCSVDQFAIFDRGAIHLPLVAVVTGSMTTVLLVDYRTLFEEGRTDEILRLLHRSVEKSALFLMPTMCFFFAFAPELITCLFGEAYRDSATVFRIYLLLLPNRTIVFGSIALAAGKTKELALASIVTLLANLVLSYVAISLLGYVGGAASTVIVIYFVNGFLRSTIAKNALGLSLRQFLPTKIIFQSIGLSLIPLIPVFILVAFVGDINAALRLSLGAIVYSAGLLGIYWKLGFVRPSMLRGYLPRGKT